MFETLNFVSISKIKLKNIAIVLGLIFYYNFGKFKTIKILIYEKIITFSFDGLINISIFSSIKK
ncbi:hypothetical protein GCM10011343_08590 [Flavobacterium orientale]|uniref:Uncharacterized protein n=1 Tax=Flavobacterium orientale TaxID=1756020 RepID=A0A916XY73_9FLAO|nr:hypothetical protein GCM10011343_08590 [Flavobacterium orientale]